MKASINRTVTESRTGQYFSVLSNSKRSLWAQYRNFNRQQLKHQSKSSIKIINQKNNIMKASISRTATESRTGQYFSVLSNSKRSLWAQYRNYNRQQQHNQSKNEINHHQSIIYTHKKKGVSFEPCKQQTNSLDSGGTVSLRAVLKDKWGQNYRNSAPFFI